MKPRCPVLGWNLTKDIRTFMASTLAVVPGVNAWTASAVRHTLRRDFVEKSATSGQDRDGIKTALLSMRLTTHPVRVRRRCLHREACRVVQMEELRGSDRPEVGVPDHAGVVVTGPVTGRQAGKFGPGQCLGARSWWCVNHLKPAGQARECVLAIVDRRLGYGCHNRSMGSA
jgi:hypothetical protein